MVLTTNEAKNHLTLQVVFKGMDMLSVKFEFNADTDTAEEVVNEMVRRRLKAGSFSTNMVWATRGSNQGLYRHLIIALDRRGCSSSEVPKIHYARHQPDITRDGGDGRQKGQCRTYAVITHASEWPPWSNLSVISRHHGYSQSHSPVGQSR